MVTERRRERERQNLRNSILRAAADIAAAEGWQGVTIRKIAEAIEYTPPVIYEYFDSKEAILLEVKREGFSQLVAMMQAAQAQASNPLDAMMKTVAAYCEFAWRCPQLYVAMNSMGSIAFDMPEQLAAQHDELFLVVRDAFVRLAPAGCFEGEQLNEAVMIAWGLIHGLVSLALAGRLPGDHAQATALIQRGVHDLIISWDSQQS